MLQLTINKRTNHPRPFCCIPSSLCPVDGHQEARSVFPSQEDDQIYSQDNPYFVASHVFFSDSSRHSNCVSQDTSLRPCRAYGERMFT